MHPRPPHAILWNGRPAPLHPPRPHTYAGARGRKFTVQVALVMVKADGSSKEVPLDRESTLIGRDEHAKLRIPVAQVSRKHCELINRAGKLSITDLGSANGTFVNGRKTRAADLQPGDLLTIGPFVFVVRINGEPTKIDAKDCFAAGTVSLEDDDDDDMPLPSKAPTAISKPAPAKPTTPSGKPSIFEDDDDGSSSVDDLLKDFKFDDDEDDDKPSKK